MKKLFMLLFVLIFSLPAFAGLKSKHIVGDWKYLITLEDGYHQVGSLKFIQKESKLIGESIEEDGHSLPLSKIIINKKNKTLCFEITRENNVAIEFILIVENNKFKGKGWINDANLEITGEKINIHQLN